MELRNELLSDTVFDHGLGHAGIQKRGEITRSHWRKLNLAVYFLEEMDWRELFAYLGARGCSSQHRGC